MSVTQLAPTAAVNGSELDDANGGNQVHQFSIAGSPTFGQPACPAP